MAQHPLAIHGSPSVSARLADARRQRAAFDREFAY